MKEEHGKARSKEWAARRYGPKENETDVEVLFTWSNPNRTQA